jgi:hypothetical protein
VGYRKEFMGKLENSCYGHDCGRKVGSIRLGSANKANSDKDHSQMTETSQSKPQPHLLKLSPIQFF